MKVKLGDVCIIQSGGTPSRSNLNYWKNGTISWVKISDIKDKYLNFTEEYITYEGLKNSSAKIFSKGTILYTIFATLGEVSILNIEAATNQAIAGIKLVDENVYNDFLYYYLVSKKEEVNNRGRGVAQNNINLSMLKNIEIEMPNIEKQRKIANVLDKVNKIINKRQQQLKKLDELVKSRFIEMFGEPDKNTFNWSKEKLGEHLDVVNGFAFKSEGFTDIGIPVLRIGNINSGTFKATNMVFWPNDATLFRYKIYPGDLVISLTGTVGKDDYGNVCILGTEYKEYYLNQRNAKLDIKNTINKYYLSQILKFNEIKNQLTGISRGVRQANISIKDILSLSVPIPPIELQDKFADFVKQTDKSKLEIQKSLDKLEILKKSLMQQYFG